MTQPSRDIGNTIAGTFMAAHGIEKKKNPVDSDNGQDMDEDTP
jgi:hypothetical protein